MGCFKTSVSHRRSFSAMLSPDSVCRVVVKPCRSRRNKSKNILIKQRVGTMLPLTVASLYLGLHIAHRIITIEGMMRAGIDFNPDGIARGLGRRGELAARFRWRPVILVANQDEHRSPWGIHARWAGARQIGARTAWIEGH